MSFPFVVLCGRTALGANVPVLVDSSGHIQGTIAGNPFDQVLDTTDSPTFVAETLSGATTDITGTWTVGAGWTQAPAGTFTHGSGTAALTNGATITAGGYYRATWTVSGRTAGSVTVALGGITLDVSTTSGNAVSTMALSSATLTVTPTTDFDGVVSDILLEQIPATLALPNESVLHIGDAGGGYIWSNIPYGTGLQLESTNPIVLYAHADETSTDQSILSVAQSGVTINPGSAGLYVSGAITLSGVLALPVLTFAALPASPAEGMLVNLSDADKGNSGQTITGGGDTHRVLARYNGTNWIVVI